MRQLPSESIDLIYIDPPFFSGRQYNVIFGDQNELRSFSDIWEGGMPGYLIWLNARLYEMKRLLKKTGSIFVHLDWHAVHYAKVEMDKIFGADKLRNEIIWCYTGPGSPGMRQFNRKHDTILWYTKSDTWVFNRDAARTSHDAKTVANFKEGLVGSGFVADTYDLPKGKVSEDWWKQYPTESELEEAILKAAMESLEAPSDLIEAAIAKRYPKGSLSHVGYPTEKPYKLLERIIGAAAPEGGVVADFFVGGGVTPMQAQRMGRRWIACDQSRVAVAITADRLTRQVEEQTGKMFPVPDFTIEHWGIYEARRLSEAPLDQFRAFVLRAFGAVFEEHEAGVHGYKGAVPIWVGEPDQKKAVTAADVQAFANAMRKTLRYKQDNLRDGIMLGWAFGRDAVEAAERLRRLEQTDLNFVRLDMIRIDSARFREHVTALSTKNADYENFLTFVQPPRVEVGYKRIAPRTYRFDASDTAVLNAGAKIINVQWDFEYGKRFSSSPGHSFVHGSKKEPEVQTQYEFPTSGRKRIACRVQDDVGGEGLWTAEIELD
ncbi:MAG: site-specific DNA-methyltransferase [Gemmatimonadota bacterium]|nr:site-specific DNA-methyltransferase [Gemmatimonadota bacterium]